MVLSIIKTEKIPEVSALVKLNSSARGLKNTPKEEDMP
jgi:hypothetical protein